MEDRYTRHAPLVKPISHEGIPDIMGLVLAGGESRRMGVDKGSIEYHGMPQRDFAFQLLDKFVSKAHLSCHPDRVPETDHAVIKDTFLDLGPYGGVLSAFRFNPNVAWLAVACDIPLLDDESISFLMAQRDITKVATCFHDPSTGLPEPMITIWEPKAYPVLLQFLGQGVSCLRKILIHSDSKHVQIARPEVLRNANTPEEVEMMQRILYHEMPSRPLIP